MHYTKEDDGLTKDWEGRIWCNPPYGRQMSSWLKRLSEHGGGGLALIFARTETQVFFDYVWNKADALLFLKGRVKFHRPDGTLASTAGSPSVLVAYGEQEAIKLQTCGLAGKFIQLKNKII
jgi:hypothetical protein